LYRLRVALRRGDETLHVTDTRFGFRTFEVREAEGLFLNGQRILLKGVNRHSFRPETGRSLTRENCYEDARLIRQLNMNAVRMSHYPPDEAFLEACDELGLYLLDELSGKLDAHTTYAPDGIVGPHFEKEGSYYAIRDIWSPVQVDAPVLNDEFPGAIGIHNRYDFTTLAQCRFAWKLLRFSARGATT